MIDSHSHIYMDRYDEDRPAVIARAAEVGILNLLQVGCNLEESRQVIALAERVPGIYASVGVHPHDADTVTDEVLDALEVLTHHPKVLSWGEIGLDFYYDNSPREIQKAAFEAQMKRAARLDLPVVIHTRDAEPETRDITARHPIPRGGHVHCFTGSGELAADLLTMGYHIGFTGIITFRKSTDLREVVAAVPLERMLIETDSPYLAPVPHRGKRNEPAYVAEVAKAIAQIKDTPVEEVVRITTENFHRLYGCDRIEWETLAS
ncbi:MAG: TatD family hydrolase [Acidobacteriota bacterium]|nr:TatD family hydrolase [Acidobacteriota bacterium]